MPGVHRELRRRREPGAAMPVRPWRSSISVANGASQGRQPHHDVPPWQSTARFGQNRTAVQLRGRLWAALGAARWPPICVRSRSKLDRA